jgi:hypothetical protein
VVVLAVSPFLFFLCFVLVFTVLLPVVVSGVAVLVFWAKTAVPLRRDNPSEAIIIFFIEFVSWPKPVALPVLTPLWSHRMMK